MHYNTSAQVEGTENFLLAQAHSLTPMRLSLLLGLEVLKEVLVLLPLTVEEHIFITLAAPVVVLEISESFPARIGLRDILVELLLLYILSHMVAQASLVCALIHYPPGRGFVLNKIVLLGFTGLRRKGNGHLLEHWFGLAGSLWLEGGVDELGGLKEVIVGLHVT